MKNNISANSSESFRSDLDPGTIDVEGMPEELEQLENDVEVNGSENNPIDFGIHIEDEDAENKDGKTFLSFVDQLKGKGVNLTGDEFVRDFMLWIESGEDYDKNKRQREIERYERWISHIHKKEPTWLDEVWGDFKKTSLWRYGKSRSGFGSERALTAILSKRASEIAAAWLPPDKIIKTFNKSCEYGHMVEAQSCLLALAHRGFLREQDMERFYAGFGVKKKIPVVSGVDKDGVGIPTFDEDGNQVFEDGYVLGKLTAWFEGYLRREAATRGGRPDTFSSGRRVAATDPNTGKDAVCFKSANWQAKETDSDILDMGGRRGNVAMATHISNFLESGDQAQAIEALLAKKRDEAPEKIALWQSKLAELTGDNLGGLPEDRLELFKKKKEELELKIRDEEVRMKLIKDKLDMGVKYDEQDPDFKSFLLDPTDYTTEITIGNKTFKEAELAVELTVRKYWQARDENDALHLIRGNHIKGIEKQTYIKLMGDRFRDEFQWSSHHHILGTRINEKYDESRDAPLKIVETLQDPKNRRNFQEFSVETRNFCYDDKAGFLDDIIAYDKANNVVKRIAKDHPLHPQNLHEELTFNVSKLIREHKEQWDALPDEKDERYAWDKLGSAIYKNDHESGNVTSKNVFMEALQQGPEVARQALLRDGLIDSIEQNLRMARSDYDSYRKNMHLYFGQFAGLNDDQKEAISVAVQEEVAKLDKNKDLKAEDVVASIPDNHADLKNNPELIRRMELEVAKFNEAEVRPYWRALATIEILEHDALQIENELEGLATEEVELENTYEIKVDKLQKTSQLIMGFSDEDKDQANHLSAAKIREIEELGLGIDTRGLTSMDAYQELMKYSFVLQVEVERIRNMIEDEDEDYVRRSEPEEH